MLNINIIWNFRINKYVHCAMQHGHVTCSCPYIFCGRQSLFTLPCFVPLPSTIFVPLPSTIFVPLPSTIFVPLPSTIFVLCATPIHVYCPSDRHAHPMHTIESNGPSCQDLEQG